MKTVILALDSQYSHTLLAPRYLKAGCRAANVSGEVIILESNVNVRSEQLIAKLYDLKPDILAVSCYIFNGEKALEVLSDIRKVLPEIIIITGGYEAESYPEKYLGLCDYLIMGEGDFVFGQLIAALEQKTNRFNKGIVKAQRICDLDSIPSPFDEEYPSKFADRIIYIESSRGCPFGCAYCMSAGTGGVRAFSIDRVMRDLDTVVMAGVKRIKFVDRTFNYDMPRAAEVLGAIVEKYNDSGAVFHFELAPELICDELIEVIARAKRGLFHFEVGVQSYREETLRAVNRAANTGMVDKNIARLLGSGAVVHADLIAGLLKEDKSSFIRGFDRLFALGVDELQLGFLKLLKGSKLYNMAEGYETCKKPPYEILKTPWLSYSEILELKRAELSLGIYHNSGRFKNSVKYLLGQNTYFSSAYEFFESLGVCLSEAGAGIRGMSAREHCDILYRFAAKKLPQKDCEALAKLISQDFQASGNVRNWRPESNGKRRN